MSGRAPGRKEVRGDLSYIDKAFGVHSARAIQEELMGRPVTLRELSDLLNLEGYPIDYSTISRMEDTIKYLWPLHPELAQQWSARLQVLSLLRIRSQAGKVWSQFAHESSPQCSFDQVFEASCRVLMILTVMHMRHSVMSLSVSWLRRCHIPA
jgi:ParB family protein of integrating conjugative element (PFGI_1 class)